MAIKVITFDLDNTLWDVTPALLSAEEAQRQWLEEHRPDTINQLQPENIASIRRQLLADEPELRHNITGIRREFLRRLQRSAGYGETASAEGADQAFAVFLEVRQQVDLYDGVESMLADLATRFTLGSLTNGNADVHKTPAGQHMSFAFLAEDVGGSKPHPALFEAAMKETGAAGDEILHVGDNPEHDIMGAIRAGLRTVWINAGGDAYPLEDRPDLTLRHVTELPAALGSL
ncbi:MAG: HAD-IA family hydrolase [Pseudomonadota bacterium]